MGRGVWQSGETLLVESTSKIPHLEAPLQRSAARIKPCDALQYRGTVRRTFVVGGVCQQHAGVGVHPPMLEQEAIQSFGQGEILQEQGIPANNHQVVLHVEVLGRQLNGRHCPAAVLQHSQRGTKKWKKKKRQKARWRSQPRMV
jgi:hypothetical protein